MTPTADGARGPLIRCLLNDEFQILLQLLLRRRHKAADVRESRATGPSWLAVAVAVFFAKL